MDRLPFSQLAPPPHLAPGLEALKMFLERRRPMNASQLAAVANLTAHPQIFRESRLPPRVTA